MLGTYTTHTKTACVNTSGYENRGEVHESRKLVLVLDYDLRWAHFALNARSENLQSREAVGSLLTSDKDLCDYAPGWIHSYESLVFVIQSLHVQIKTY